MDKEERLTQSIEDTKKKIQILKEKKLNIDQQLSFLKEKLVKLEEEKTTIRFQENKNPKTFEDNDFPWSNNLKDLLQENFNLKEFRSKQLPAINATLSKKDVLVVMPTGGGKSLIYQITSLIDRHLTLVVSPLISLIEDQLKALKKFGINAATENGNTKREEKQKIRANMAAGSLNVLFITPEYFAQCKMFINHLQKTYEKGLLDRVVIDEVHCVSTWGHDFRKDYQMLAQLKTLFPTVPILGLTATATSKVLMDIQKLLDIRNAVIITAPFNRPNLFYRVIDKSEDEEKRLDALVELIEKKFKGQSGIIYVNTISDTEQLSNKLQDRNIRAKPYHAMLDADMKTKIHERWLQNSYQIIVATIAFGMGIDKPDVRFVIHYSVPKSMEGYYQESGRAGRDGQRAECILMFNLTDVLKNIGNAVTKKEEENNYAMLNYVLNFTTCRRKLIAAYFEDDWCQNHCENMCDNCPPHNKTLKTYNLLPCLKDISKIIETASGNDVKLTLLKLVNAWYQSGPKNCRVSSVNSPSFEKKLAETIIGTLLLQGYLKISKGFTAYSVISYLQVGEKPYPASIEFTYPMKSALSKYETPTSSQRGTPPAKKPRFSKSDAISLD